MSKGLVRSTVLNLAVLVVKLCITFFMTPVILRSLGNYDYGIWEVVVSVIGYMGLLDLGVRPAIARYSARYLVEANPRELSELYSSTVFFLLGVGVLCGAGLAVFGWNWPEVLAPGGASTEKYTFLLMLIGAQLLFTFPGFVPESFLEGYQKYHVKNYFIIADVIIGSVLLYWALTHGYGLVAIAVLDLIGNFAKYAFFAWYISREPNGPKLALAHFNWPRLREVMGFGVKSFIQGAAYQLQEGANTLIIAGVLGPAKVVFYSIPANLVNYIKMFCWAATHALMPFFADLDARGLRETTHLYYVLGSRLVLAGVYLLVVGVAVLGEDFVSLWVGPDYGLKVRDMLWLLLSLVVLQFVNPFSIRYLTAIGKHGIYAIVGPMAAIAQIGGAFVGIKLLGKAEGVLWGAIVPWMVTTPIYFFYCMRQLELNPLFYVANTILRLLPACAVLAFALVELRSHFEVNNMLELFGIALAATAAYLPAVWWLALNAAERKMLRNGVMRGRQIAVSGGGDQ